MAAASIDQFVYKPESAHEDWPIWIFRFENFLKISQTDLTSNEGKILAAQHLIVSGGAAVVRVLKSFENMETATYAQIKEAITAYCTPKDTMAALHKFTGTRQKTDETLGDYVIRLKPLAFAGGISTVNSDKELLRVIGQHSNSVEVKLKSLEKDMTTAKLVIWYTTLETHNRAVQLDQKNEDINFVTNDKRKKQPERPNNNKKCHACGGPYPHEGTCPARGKRCEFCNIMNHFASQCRKKKQSIAAPGQYQNRYQSTNQSSKFDDSRQNRQNFQRPRSGFQGNHNRNSGNHVYQINETMPQQTNEDRNQELFNMFYNWLDNIQDQPNNKQYDSTQ